MERRDLARDGIDFFGDAEIRGPAPDVVGRVRTALPLRKCLNGSVPRIGAHTRRFADRDAEIVPKLGTGDTLRLIFPETRRPLAGEVDLSWRRNRRERDK